MRAHLAVLSVRAQLGAAEPHRLLAVHLVPQPIRGEDDKLVARAERLRPKLRHRRQPAHLPSPPAAAAAAPAAAARRLAVAEAARHLEAAVEAAVLDGAALGHHARRLARAARHVVVGEGHGLPTAREHGAAVAHLGWGEGCG